LRARGGLADYECGWYFLGNLLWTFWLSLGVISLKPILSEPVALAVDVDFVGFMVYELEDLQSNRKKDMVDMTVKFMLWRKGIWIVVARIGCS
jgi:hypothetical protein